MLGGFLRATLHCKSHLACDPNVTHIYWSPILFWMFRTRQMALVTPVWILTLSSRMLAVRNQDVECCCLLLSHVVCVTDRYCRTVNHAGWHFALQVLNGVSVSGIRKWRRVAPELHTHTHTHTQTPPPPPPPEPAGTHFVTDTKMARKHKIKIQQKKINTHRIINGFYTDSCLQLALYRTVRDRAVINLTVSLCMQGPCDSEKNLKTSAPHGCLRFQGQCVEGNGTFQGQCVE
jgi:hypothetical protein